MYKTFMRHAKKVTNSVAVGPRPILGGVKHFYSGSLAVTDSHRLYIANDIHDKGDAVITPDGKKLEGTYPDIERLLPNEYDGEKLTVNVNEMFKGMDIIHTATKLSDDVDGDWTTWEGNLLNYGLEEVVSAQYELPYSLPLDSITSNPKYWVEALQLFRAFKYREVEISFHGKFRPFTLTSPDKQLLVLILPIRRY